MIWFVASDVALLLVLLVAFVRIPKAQAWGRESYLRVLRRLRGLSLLPAVAVAVAGGFAIAVAATWVLRNLIHTSSKPADPIDITKLSFTVAGGVGAAVALVVAYRRQRDIEQGRFVERFGAAAAQLGDHDVAVRIAGAYAMAGVADESTGIRRQQCIDVLCGYLRLPYDPDQGSSNRAELVTTTKKSAAEPIVSVEEEVHQRLRQNDREVRQTIVRIITAHLQEHSEISWSLQDFDFTGVLFEGSRFANAIFGGRHTSFENAVFTGTMTDFRKATFLGEYTSFAGATFNCSSNFMNSAFSGRRTDFYKTEFKGNNTTFDFVKFSGGGIVSFQEATFSSNTFFREAVFGNDVIFWETTFRGQSTFFTQAAFRGQRTSFDRARFGGEHTVFNNATFSSGYTSFGRGAIFNSRRTSFDQAEFSGEHTSFNRAAFTGKRISFRQAIFSGEHTSYERSEFSAEHTSFEQAAFSGAYASFERAAFSGEHTSFNRAEFTGDDVSFERPTVWENVSFDWALKDSEFKQQDVTQVVSMPSCIHPREWPPQKWAPPKPENTWDPAEAAVIELVESVNVNNEYFEDQDALVNLLAGDHVHPPGQHPTLKRTEWAELVEQRD